MSTSPVQDMQAFCEEIIKRLTTLDAKVEWTYTRFSQIDQTLARLERRLTEVAEAQTAAASIAAAAAAKTPPTAVFVTDSFDEIPPIQSGVRRTGSQPSLRLEEDEPRTNRSLSVGRNPLINDGSESSSTRTTASPVQSRSPSPGLDAKKPGWPFRK